jgi:hypothetical protein
MIPDTHPLPKIRGLKAPTTTRTSITSTSATTVTWSKNVFLMVLEPFLDPQCDLEWRNSVEIRGFIFWDILGMIPCNNQFPCAFMNRIQPSESLRFVPSID